MQLIQKSLIQLENSPTDLVPTFLCSNQSYKAILAAIVGVAFKQMVEEIGILYRSDHIQNGLINVLYGERCFASLARNVPVIAVRAITKSVITVIQGDGNPVTW